MAFMLVDKNGKEVDPKTLDGREDYTLVNTLPYTMPDIPDVQMLYMQPPMGRIKERGQSNRKCKSTSKNKRKMINKSKRKNRKR